LIAVVVAWLASVAVVWICLMDLLTESVAS